MEGNLLKWTNYWNGWQIRWFILKDGILSYYNNQNEIKSGAKRSFKISMFDIIGIYFK
jgi:pleckstrin family protein A (phosphoinositide binding specific) protein 8